VFYTEDFGIVEGDPTAVVRTGRIAPFLQWATDAPPGYLGDGVSERQVKGSPFGTDFVRIVGPRIREGGGRPDPTSPADMDRIWTDLFTVQGRVAKRVGATLGAATYAVAGDTQQLRVQASSIPGQSLELVGNGTRVALESSGIHYVGIADAPTPPSDSALFNVTDVPPTRWPITFTDEVIVERAVHDLDADTLTVTARSSDPAASLTLPALGLAVTSNPQVFPGLAAVPAVLEVVSDKGGSGRQKVELVGTPFPNLGVEVHAVAPVNGVATEEVVLDGSGSRGATAFAWSQTAGAAVALTGANSPQASFTPISADTYGFTLTVQGTGGPKTTAVSIVVGPEPGPDTLTFTRAEYRTGRRQFRIEGTVDRVPNQVTARMGAFEIGRAAPDITGAWAIRHVLAEADAGNAPVPGAAVEVQSKRGPSLSQQVLIRN
jgi:hypothetical protein